MDKNKLNSANQRQQTEVIDDKHLADDTARENALTQEKRRRRSKPLLVFLLTLFMAALAALAALLVYKAYFEKQPVTSNTTPQITSTPKKLTAQELITVVSPKLSGTDVTDKSTYMAPAVKLAGYTYYVAPFADEMPLATVEKMITASQTPVDRAAIGKVFSDKGFSAKEYESTESEPSMTVYSQADVMCSVADTRGSNEAADHTVAVVCANMTDYISFAGSVKPYATVYQTFARDDSDTSAILFTKKPVVKASKTSGYQTAELGIGNYTDGRIGVGGFMGLFYQTPDKKWHFFKGTQNLLNCDEFSDNEVKKAFAGEKCMKTNTEEGTVFSSV